MNKLNGNDTLLAPLQGLRVLATLAIFLYHSGILVQGAFPVTFFFMLSGFLLYYNKHTLNGYDSFLLWLSYVWKKLKEFYPLHFITFIYALVLFESKLDAVQLKSALLNVLLLQSISEKHVFGYNGLSWYLSVLMMLYVVGFFLIKLLNQFQRYWKGMTLITLLFIFGWNLLLWFDVPIYEYGNPLYRVLDFFLGMLIGYLFVNKKLSLTDGRKASAYEAAICAVFVVLYFLSLALKPKCGYYSIFFSIAIYLFAHSKGWISKVLGSKFFLRAAKYSFAFYMTHELVLRTLRMMIPVESMGHYSRIFLICVIAFPITVVISVIVQKIQAKIKRKE